jgi:hypothetical protein
MNPDTSAKPIDDTRGITPPAVEPIEFEEIASAAVIATDDEAKGEPASQKQAPGWFKKGRDQKPARSEGKRRHRKRKPLIVEQDAVPLTWQQELYRRLFGNDGAGLGVSLLVHFVVLSSLSLSYHVVAQMEGDKNFAALGSFGEGEQDGFDEVLISTEEDAGGNDQEEFTPETELFTVAESETKETDPQELNNVVDDLVSDSFGQGEGDNTGDGKDGASGASGTFGKTGNAVSKGSFTVWTVPELPKPDRYYDIVIQVKLPKGAEKLRSTDLSGEIIGDDSKFDIRLNDYRQAIPWDKKMTDVIAGPYVKYPGRRLKKLVSPGRSSRGRVPFLPVKGGFATLIIKVPGGAKKVTDTVVINSKMLKESQTLKIQFEEGR